VIFHRDASNEWDIVRVDAAGGLNAITDWNMGNTVTTAWTTGALAASPDGSKLAWADYSGQWVQIFDFNNATGNISNAVSVSGTEAQAEGVEFSPDGTRLFFSQATPAQNLKYCNLTGGGVTTISSGYNFGEIEVLDDGVMYVAVENDVAFSSILTPNGAPSFSLRTTPFGPQIGLGLPQPVYNLPNTACPIVVLAVEMVSFTATASNGIVLLNWETASEKDSYYFEVQRSVDGLNWLPIGVVNGAGNSSLSIQYSYTDYSPANGLNYYRLRQVEYDGKYNFSEIRAVSLKGGSALRVLTSENGNLEFAIDQDIDASGIVEIYDVTGKRLSTDPVILQQGHRTYQINTIDMSTGIYFLKLSYTNGTVQAVKFSH